MQPRGTAECLCPASECVTSHSLCHPGLLPGDGPRTNTLFGLKGDGGSFKSPLLSSLSSHWGQDRDQASLLK